MTALDDDHTGRRAAGDAVYPVWVRRTTVAAVLLVAAVAAVVSYAHMREVADRAGEGWRAHLLPLSVDGLVVAASMVLLTRRRTGLPGGWLPWCALLGAVGASLAANIAAAEPTVTARVVAAWPAVAFAVAFELLLEQRRHLPGDPPNTPPAAAYVPAMAGEPAGQAPPAPDADVGEAVGERAVLAARARELLAASPGRPPGRRALARELGVTEHQARAVLNAVTTAGAPDDTTSGAAQNGARADGGAG